jgi:hypothetical protein
VKGIEPAMPHFSILPKSSQEPHFYVSIIKFQKIGYHESVRTKAKKSCQHLSARQ